MRSEFTNMMVIMLDPCFTALRIVENLVGHMNAFLLTSKYDVKVVVHLLMVRFDILNLDVGKYVIAAIDVIGLELGENMFGVGSSIESIEESS